MGCEEDPAGTLVLVADAQDLMDACNVTFRQMYQYKDNTLASPIVWCGCRPNMPHRKLMVVQTARGSEEVLAMLT